jgi:hypothetical protein
MKNTWLCGRLEPVQNLQTYCYSLSRYGTSRTLPRLIGGLPEGFRVFAPFTEEPSCSTRTKSLFNDKGEAYGVKAGKPNGQGAYGDW